MDDMGQHVGFGRDRSLPFPVPGRANWFNCIQHPPFTSLLIRAVAKSPP
jgi:hypothetical protein